jgi:hypothetical protein
MLHANNRLKLASGLLVLMLLSYIAHLVAAAVPLWFSGLSTWCALLLILSSLPLSAFKQFFALFGIGVGLLGIGLARGADFHWQDLVLQNNGLINLLYGVSFLRVLALANPAPPAALPVGKTAFLQTLFGVHLLGAVINMSILVLMAERLQQQHALSKTAVTVLTRGFSMAAFWSPFFAAMAIALTYAPQAHLPTVVAYGLGLMSLGMLLTIGELGGWRLHKVADFQGYPLHWRNLIVPSFLALAVFVLHYVWPSIPVIIIVSGTALLLSVCYAYVRQGSAASALIKTHIAQSPRRMARELALFLGAGILSLGVQVLFSTLNHWHPLTQFGALQASGLLAIAILVSILGVHPVVSIAVLSNLVQPLHPNPTTLAIVCLSIWSLGVVASPFSGVNTVLGSQFQVKARDLIQGNLLYVLLMWLCVSLVLFIQQH